MSEINATTTDKLHVSRPFKKFVATGPQKDYTYNRIPTFTREALPWLRGLFMSHLASSAGQITRSKHDTAFEEGIKGNRFEVRL